MKFQVTAATIPPQTPILTRKPLSPGEFAGAGEYSAAAPHLTNLIPHQLRSPERRYCEVPVIAAGHVKFPEMRGSLVLYIRDFADPEHVRRVWVEGHIDPNVVDSFDNACDELYDSLGVYPDPRESVGYQLKDAEEASALKLFFDRLDHFSVRYPGNAVNQLSTQSHEWKGVQAAAEGFLAVVKPDVVASAETRAGVAKTLEAPSRLRGYSVVFEDDGDTGYFYALISEKRADPGIVDAMLIYNVASVPAAEHLGHVQLIWSADGLKAALLINEHMHGVFDFEMRRGYCRTNFPPPKGEWARFDHSWNDAGFRLFGIAGK